MDGPYAELLLKCITVHVKGKTINLINKSCDLTKVCNTPKPNKVK